MCKYSYLKTCNNSCLHMCICSYLVQKYKMYLYNQLQMTTFFICCITNWKSHATLTLLAKQDLLTFGYNMIDPLKSWCWGSILFYPYPLAELIGA